MSIGKDRAVRRSLRTLFNLGTIGELTDGQLLERFATEPGEPAELAFAALVERHGPMVMRVCRGVLADPNDAQDAFQATFLVLVRRARGLWVRDSIGPWLHQVACRTAACARVAAARRRRHERHAAELAAATIRPQADVELERLLHEEIDRLPERYRSPVVLCDIEGRTHEQAARHLGWSVGTVKSRLSRAHGRLRDRLTRRGIGPEVRALAPIGGAGLSGPAWTVPPALLEATTTVAVRFAGIGRAAAVPGSAASLARGVLKAMSMTHWWKAATVLLVAGATASGVEWLGSGGDGPPGPAAAPSARQKNPLQAGDAPTREATPGRLRHVVFARGTVEPGRTSDLYCRVEGSTTIIRIVPEGTRVKKGQVICELDSAAVRDRLVNQVGATKDAEAAYQRARLAREVAEIALVEYREGVYKQDEQQLQAEIDGIRAATRKTEGRLERTREAGRRVKDMLARAGGARTPADIVAEVDIQDRLEDAEGSLERQKRSLAEAERRHEVLEKYTRPRTIKQLEGELEKARVQEITLRTAWERSKILEKQLAVQIKYCMITAPQDGVVVLANDPNRYFGAGPQIEEGATVRERQKIASVYDPNGPMQINAKVDEADIKSVRRKMPVQVKVDAYASATMPGVVTEIAPLPDPGSFFSNNVKVYTTRVRIDKSPVHLVPGLTASAEIAAGELENVLGVPKNAVIHYNNGDHLAVKADDGKVEWRDAVLGASDGTNVEVKQGLKAGEKVIVDPRPFLTGEQKAILEAEHGAALQEDAQRQANIRKAAELRKARRKASANR